MSQSIRSNKNMESSSMNFVINSQRVVRKDVFRAWSDWSIFSDDVWFFYVQLVQKRHKEAALHAFLSFFHANLSCQLAMVHRTLLFLLIQNKNPPWSCFLSKEPQLGWNLKFPISFSWNSLPNSSSK